MKLQFFDERIYLLRFKNVFYADEQFIEKFEEKYNLTLPKVYKELLLNVGLDVACGIFRNEYNLDNYDEMLAIINEYFLNNDFLKEGYFPFALNTNPDTVFWSFRLNEGDNPSVYKYSEITKAHEKSYDKFTDCFYDYYDSVLKSLGKE